jgi:phosphatidylserine decarboxylase
MRLDSAGLPFIIGALALAVLMGALTFAAGGSATVGWTLATPFVVLGAFFAFFFRDPERRMPPDASDEVVLSPADGRVLVAGQAEVSAAPEGEWQQISIFLSPMDVHVNRVPASGRVTRVNFMRGTFLPAYRREAATANERSEIWIDHRGQAIVARQIVGMLARRVVCRVEPGATVRAGDRFGIMKFGSRMDVFVPTSATIAVTVGQRVRGGETVIAVLHSKPSDTPPG